MKHLLKKSILTVALLGFLFGMPWGMLATAAPVTQMHSAVQLGQSNDCTLCGNVPGQNGAPHHGGGQMAGSSCVGAGSCAMMLAAPPGKALAAIPLQRGVCFPERNCSAGRLLSGPDPRPPDA